MNRLFGIFVLAAATLLAGCASGLMRDAASQQITAPAPGRVKIVFMRSSMVAGAVGCELYEVSGGEPRFIGQLPTGNKLVYETTPGDKVFMAHGYPAADFMPAKLSAGKTYYSIVRPNWGTGGFAPTPIRAPGAGTPDLNSKEFQDWLTGTKLIEPTPSASGWFAENKSRVLEVYTDYWARFQRKSDAEKRERTLLPEDGR